MNHESSSATQQELLAHGLGCLLLQIRPYCGQVGNASHSAQICRHVNLHQRRLAEAQRAHGIPSLRNAKRSAPLNARKSDSGGDGQHFLKGHRNGGRDGDGGGAAPLHVEARVQRQRVRLLRRNVRRDSQHVFAEIAVGDGNDIQQRRPVLVKHLPQLPIQKVSKKGENTLDMAPCAAKLF
jgi:hypothetical protein